MIVASNLTKRYPGGYEALRDVSFDVLAWQDEPTRAPDGVLMRYAISIVPK